MKKGQALLTILFIVSISLVIFSAGIIVVSTNTVAGTKFQQGSVAYHVAESGAENAILKLLRDPSYTGETMTVGDGTATITVTGSMTKTILSEGQVGNFLRKIQVVVDYTNNVLTVSSWQEIP